MSQPPEASHTQHTLTELTLEEKAALVSGSGFWHTVAVERVGVRSIMVSDGPHGLRAQLEKADHVGLGGSVPATCFPPACGLAGSWNPELVATVGEALAAEARRWGVSVVLGPGVNIKRSPLCGRNFEYFSEDPFLAGRLGAALVRGLQSRGVGASLKHYAANNQEDDRLRVSAEVDERTLREIYLPAFEHIVTTEQPWTVMCAYNRVNGTHASEHRWLLTDVLRDEWGFEGLVVSDWGAVHDRVRAVAAGLDLEMPPNLEQSPAAVVRAVGEGSLDESVLDAAVARVLHLVDRSQPALDEGGSFDEAQHHAVCHRAALECAVLLKNDDAALPLRPAAGSTVAVIGEFARTPRFQGGGSSEVNPTRVDVALDELRDRLGDEVTVTFAPGYAVGSDGDPGDPGTAALLSEAVAAADGADHVVVFLGLAESDESEGFDRTHIRLPGDQLRLIEAVGEVAAPVVVLSHGSVVEMSSWEHHAAAVLDCWLSGQAGGGAVADLLTGRANPSGRLAETIPLRLEDNPSFLNFPGELGEVRYGEGVFVGYRGYDRSAVEVSYPFGHGLSYTTFDLADLAVDRGGTVAGGDLMVRVSVSVTNSGPVAGAEVVQVYVGDLDSAVARPPRELKGFAKVRLDPGSTERVSVELDQRAFSYWSRAHGDWRVEAGDFTIAVGRSSRDLPLSETVRVEAPRVSAPLSDESTLHEWLADARGRALLTEQDIPLLGDPHTLSVVGSMPMRTLASFPGMTVDHRTLDRLLAVYQDQPRSASASSS